MVLRIEDIGVPVVTEVLDEEQRKRMDNSLFYAQQFGIEPETAYDLEPQLNIEAFGKEVLSAQPGKILKDAILQSLATKPAMAIRGTEYYTPGDALGIDKILDKTSTYLESLKDPELEQKLAKVASGRLWPIGDDRRWWQVEARYLPEVINAWAANVGDQIPLMLITQAGRQAGKLIGKPVARVAGLISAQITGVPATLDPADVATAPAVVGITQEVIKHLGGAAPLVAIEAAGFVDEATNLGIDADIAEKYARPYGLGSGAIEYAQWLWVLGRYSKIAEPAQKTIMKQVLTHIGGSLFEGVEEISQGGLQNFLLQKAVKEMKERHPDYTGEAPDIMEDWKRDGAIGAGVAAITGLPGTGMTMTQGALARRQQVSPETKKFLGEPSVAEVEKAAEAPVVPEAPIVAPEPTEAPSEALQRVGEAQAEVLDAIKKYGYGGITEAEQHPNLVAAVHKREAAENDLFNSLSEKLKIGDEIDGYKLRQAKFDLARTADTQLKTGMPVTFDFTGVEGVNKEGDVRIFREDQIGQIESRKAFQEFVKPTEAAPAVVAEVGEKKAKPEVKEPITKPERESLRDIGYTVPEIADMEPKAARRLLKKPVNAEKFTPDIVNEQIKGKRPEVTEESKNAPTVLEHYWREYDEQEFITDVETKQNQQSIASAMNKKVYAPFVDADVKDMSAAMMLYIDLKEHPAGHKFANEFKGRNKTLYEQSQNLPANIRKIADRIIEQNRKAGEMAVERGVIKEARENYIAHLWERNEKYDRFVARFRQTTARTKQRQLEGGIAEGLSEGMKLRVEDVTLASQIARSQVNQAAVGKQLLKMGKEWGLLSHQQEADDWVRVEHPGFTTWRYRGTVELGADKPRGANIYVTDEGVVMEKVPVYAEPELGKKLNKIFAPSVLYKVPGVDTLTLYNAVIKSMILQTSLFHHQAFLRSYAFGSHGINAVEAFKKGKEAIMNMEPEVRLLVRNGLTLGRIQDYDPRMLEGEDTIWGKVFALTEPTEKVNEWLQNLRRKQERFLFNKLGPYLKVQASLLELRAGFERNRAAIERGEMTADDVAQGVATLMNNDFGGLHLGRMGRSNTMQHLMRLMLLAPDWTESNVRSMIDAFKKGETGYMHRMFWGRIAIKGLGATILFNLLMSAFDDEDFVERYRKAWREGKLRWLDIDITPIYKAMGGKTDSRKYFSLIGHFRDPVKFVSRPGRSLKHKGSVVSRMVFDFASGQDWAGRQYTTVGELLGVSEEGKLQGRLVKWGQGKAQVLEPEQLPSWFIYEGRQMMPIPIQNMAAFISGEAEAFDAITKSMGMMTSTTYPEKGRRGRRTVTRRRSTRR